MTESPDLNRRPLASRSLGIFKRTASWLAARGVSPNLISVSSVVFASLGAAAMHWALWLPAAICIQLRLLANMLDGMVAVETGATSPMGELYNEIPDRLSDGVLLVALGYSSGARPELGYTAALLAVFVAYLRAMGALAGAGQVFDGWMAKPQRMFAVTVTCLFMAFGPRDWVVGEAWGLGATGWVLALICVGCLATAFTRIRRIAARIKLQPEA